MRYIYPILLCFLLLLSGCSSIRENAHYQYAPPENYSGKRCVAQCQQGKSSCEDLCVMKHPNCYANVLGAAQQKFDEYKREQKMKGRKISKRLRDFEDFTTCKRLCHCTYAYNICYTACGGKVN